MVPSEIAVWVRNESGPAPCQCRSPGGTHTMSPAPDRRGVSPSLQTQPVPAMTLEDLAALVVVPVRPRARA